MDGFVIFIIVFFLVFVVQGFRKQGARTYKPEKVSQKRVRNWAKSEMSGRTIGNDPANSERSRANMSFAKANQARMTAHAARRSVDVLEGMDTVRDPHDKNRHRRSDWGSRAGPGILSLKNTAILIAAGILLLWIISQLPTN